MTIVVGGYTDFERKLIVAAYYTSNQSNQDRVSLKEIFDRYLLELNVRWIRTALMNFRDAGWSKEGLHNGAALEQRVRLTADGLKEAERIIESQPVGFLQLKTEREMSLDSSSWTRRPSLRLEEERRARLLTLLSDAEDRLDGTELGNFERSQALAYITAIRALAESPEAPEDLIWEMVSRANHLAGVAALFVSIIGLFT